MNVNPLIGDLAPFMAKIKVPPAELGAVLWQVLVACGWVLFQTSIDEHNQLLPREEHIRIAGVAFGRALEQIPASNPYRAELQRYFVECVLPALEAAPARPVLKLV